MARLPKDPRDYFVHNKVSLIKLSELYTGQKGCSLSNLKTRSVKESWQDQQTLNWAKSQLKADEIIIESKASEIAQDLSKLEELKDLTIEVHLEFMRKLKGQIKDITNPYLLDGEKTNSLFQTAMNNAVKVLLVSLKDPDDSFEDAPVPGINISEDINA